MRLQLIRFRFLFAMVGTALCLGTGCCDYPEEDRAELGDPWEGYTVHEKIFSVMDGEHDSFPDDFTLTDDYSLIMFGYWEPGQPDEEPRKIAATLGVREDRTIRRAVGLEEIEALFAQIKPGSTIRSYYRCLVPMTYDVPEEEEEKARALIPDGLEWVVGEFGNNLICTCPKSYPLP